MMGFEVELDRCVTDDQDNKLEPDEALAVFGSFTLVTDSRHAEAQTAQAQDIAYSNVEMVTEPFDQSVQPHPAVALIVAMRAVAQVLYTVKKNQHKWLGNLLAGLLGTLGARLTGYGSQAVVHGSVSEVLGADATYDAADRGVNSLFVHYTVGIPVGQLGPAVQWIGRNARADTPKNFGKLNAERAGRAGTAAGRLFRRWAVSAGVQPDATEVAALEGFVALVYTQVSAIIDDHVLADGIAKNKTVALCRVPLREVAKVLPVTVRTFLAQQSWADTLADNSIQAADAVDRFTAHQAAVAQKLLSSKQAYLAGEISRLTNAIQSAQGNDPDLALAVRKQSRELAALQAQIASATSASQEWSSIGQLLPAYRDLLAEEAQGWSIINNAIVPALEGRMLGPAYPDGNIFLPQVRADGGRERDLNTAATCNSLSAAAKNEGMVITLGDYLGSAFLAPGVRTIQQAEVFGGMHELLQPEQANGIDLVPLELRKHGISRVTWDQLGQEVTVITNFSLALVQASTAPPAPQPQPAHPGDKRGAEDQQQDPDQPPDKRARGEPGSGGTQSQTPTGNTT
jgi:hypothetical protein